MYPTEHAIHASRPALAAALDAAILRLLEQAAPDPAVVERAFAQHADTPKCIKTTRAKELGIVVGIWKSCKKMH